MNEVLDFILAVRPILGAFLCLAGGILAVIGTIGVLRFPDLYTRIHAASVTDTGAFSLAILGMLFLSPDWLVAFKLLAVWLFLFITGPASSHALANAAHVAGLQPLIGRGDQRGAEEEAS